MIKLSACIEIIFTEVPFSDRIDRVSEIGLPAFEFWGWGRKDIDEIKRRKQEHGVEIAAFGVDPMPSIVDRGNASSFITAVENSVKVAHELGCKTLIVTTGNELKGVPRSQQHESIVESLRKAAATAEREKVTLVLEPLNVLVDHMGYYLSSSSEGFDIVREVGSQKVKLLYDIYHQQVTEGNLISTIMKNIDMIGHFHSADVPGRHEPGTGEINYANVLRAVDDAGYEGYVGLEFKPTRDSGQALRTIIDIAKSIG
ncbi:MAG TPA: TIM barrel protein [Thermoproteota archaeon]|nr:TIM barrel protein [Thermoproteota archaeon]